MKKVGISGWEIDLPRINHFDMLSELLLSQDHVKSEPYFNDEFLTQYFKLNHNPQIIKYKNKKNNIYKKIKALIDNGLKKAKLTIENLKQARVKFYIAGHGPRADYFDYQGFYDKNDAEDVYCSPKMKNLHARSYGQDKLSTQLFKDYALNWPPIPIYCASNSALMSVHIGQQEISIGITDIVIILSWNDTLIQDISFMDGQNMLVNRYAQPFSQYSDGVVLSGGYAVCILENKEYAEKRGHTLSAYIDYSLFMQSNAERNIGGTLFSFYTISKILTNILALSPYSSIDIGAIFIHGNGSIISDKAEAMAILSVFKENINIPILSYKGQIGYVSNCSGIIDLMIMADSFNHKRLIPSFSHYPVNDTGNLNFLSNQPILEYQGEPMLKIGLGMDGSIIAMIVTAENRSL